MGVTTSEKLLTAEEFALLPEPLEGGKMELVKGRICMAPPVGEEHGQRALDIGAELRRFSKTHRLGTVLVETGFRLSRDPDTVRAPDVAFVAESRLDPARDRTRYLEGPPDLAVEVVSPGDRDREVQEKLSAYFAAGTPRVWVVRPDQRTVTVHRPGGDGHTYGIDDTLTSADAGFAVAGFDLALRELFE